MHVCTPVGPVKTRGQVVVVHWLSIDAAIGVHAPAATGVGPTTTGGGQVVAMYELPPDAGIAVHEATGVGPVTTAAGHVVVVH